MKKVLLLTNTDNLEGLREQTPSGNLILDEYCFYLNENIEEVDYLVSYSKGRTTSDITINTGVSIIITGEPIAVYRYSKRYLKQFAHIYSSQKIKGVKSKFSPPFQPWWYGRDDSFKNDKLNISISWDQLRFKKFQKLRTISLISSSKVKVDGHIDRINFTEYCLNSSLSIDVFGRGYNPFIIKDKVLDQYKYHVVIENTRERNYISEKLTDALLAGCFVFYHGAPNVYDYFPDYRIIQIDITKPSLALDLITKAINNNIYEETIQYQELYKEIVMNNFNLFNQIVLILNSIKTSKLIKKKFRSDGEFLSLGKIQIMFSRILTKIKWKIIRSIG